MSDAIDDFRALKQFRALVRARFGVPCPRCISEQPRRQPTRFHRKLEADFARKAGIDRETIDWGDLLVFVIVGCCVLYPIARAT